LLPQCVGRSPFAKNTQGIEKGTKQMSTIYARLKPYNPKGGAIVSRYSYKSHSFMGGERPTWYQVDPAFAEELAKLTQDPENPTAIKLFQIVGEQEKNDIDKDEQENYLVRLGALSQTVPMPRDHRPSQVIDMRSVEEDEMPAGRAAALPPPRAAEESRTASIGPVTPLAIPVPSAPMPTMPPAMDNPGAITTKEVTSTRRSRAKHQVPPA
jgi:hypothetical protein